MRLLTRKLNTSVFAVVLLFMASCGSAPRSGEDLTADVRDAKMNIQQNFPEAAELFNSSYGYVIFPNVGKGAYIIGGASGNGIVYQNGNEIGYADLKQVDVGLQIGGKSFVEVVFFQNQDELEDFKDGEYELSANASAVILEKGVSREVNFEDGIAVITVPKGGAMVGISVGGQRFAYRAK